MASSSGNYSDAEHSSAVDESPAPGPHAVGSEGYVDFDEYIDIQLRKAGNTIKSTDVLTAVVGAGTLLTAYLLAFIVLDQWLIPGGFATTTRVLLLSGLLVAVLAWVGWKVVWPWRRRVNGLYSASTIEKASPAFKGSLVNLVDLLRAEREIPPEVYRSLERRAAVALTHVDVRETVDRRLLLRLSMALFAVVVLFCGYWILSPKNPASSLWRAIAPASETGVATRTKIDSVRPGDVDVVARSQVDVTAEVRGQLPPQAALYYTTADHKFVDERIDARPTAEGSREFHFVINGDNGAGVLQDMTYRIVAGDDSTKDYKIHVIQPPSATIDSIRLDYPEYTRLGSSTQSTGAIDAIEGTRVTLHATANMPLRSASLQFFDDESASKRAEEVPVHVESGNKLQAEWTLQMRSDGTYPHFYRIMCTSVGGESERSPSMYALEIRADRPPEIVLVDPKTDLDLPANAELPLLIEARDPDFALSYINLKIEKDGASVIGPEIYDGHDHADHPDQHVRKTYKWSLKEYHFKPKDTITYWLEAQDNRKPLANTTNSSPRLRIHITDPVPESQVKQNFHMAEQKQKDEEKRIDEQNAQQKPDEEQQVADATKTRQDRSKPQPKDKPSDAHSQQQEPSAEQRVQEQEQQQQQQTKGEPGGSGGDGDSKEKGAGDKGAGDKGNTGEQSGGDNGQSQKLNPDDSQQDAKVLEKLHDAMQKEGEQGGDGAQSKPQEGDKDPKQKGNDSRDGGGKADADKSKPEGSDSKSNDPSAKEAHDKQQGQPGQKQREQQQPGSASDSSKQPDSKTPDGNNTDGKQPDGQNPDKPANPNGAANSPNPNPSPQRPGRTPFGNSAPNPPSAGDNNSQSQGDKKPDGGQGDKPVGEQPKDNKQPGENQPSGQNQPGDNQPSDKSGDKPNQKPGDKKPGEPQAGDKQTSPAGDNQQNQKQDAGQKPAPGQKPDGGQKQDAGQAGDKSQPAPNESRGKDEKGQSSSGDRSPSDNKNDGRSSDPKSPPDQGQPSKPDAANQSQGKQSQGKSPNDQQRDRSQSGNPQQNSSQQNSSQQDPSQQNSGRDEKGKKDPKAATSPDGQPNRGEKSQDRKDATKGTDATSRNPDHQQAQQDAGAKQSTGRPENDPPNVKSREVPQGDKSDDQKAKRKPAKAQEPEEAAKGVDQKTDKDRASSMRDEQQPNDRGSEQSGVGKTGDLKRTQDKESPLSQQGTNEPGAKQKSAPKDPASKKGSDQSSPADQSARPQPGEKGNPPKSGEQPQNGQPQNGQPQQGQKSGQEGQPKPGESGQPAEGQQGQPGEKAQNGQQGKDGQSKSGDGKPGDPGQSSQPGKSGDGKQPSKGDGKPGTPGMGQGRGAQNGGGGHNNGNGTGSGEALTNTEKEANLDYARKATDLMLNRLQSQLSRGQVDEKVLKELGWTKDEVRRFVERMRRQAQSDQGGNTPADEARRLQFEETLKSLDFKRSSKSRSGANLKKAGVPEIEGHRSTPPAEFRDLYNAYTKSLSNPQTPREKK